MKRVVLLAAALVVALGVTASSATSSASETGITDKTIVIGGTSAVAPLWAALVARIVQSTGSPLGLAQPKLYDSIRAGQVATGFRDITAGDNGAYSAVTGWDACTGLGVPQGSALLGAL